MRTFRLPDLGEGLQDAEIVAWHVAPGQNVVADQPLVSVETDKAVVEVPSPWSGVVRVQHAAAGDRVPVGAPLADIETEVAASERAGTVVGDLPGSAERAQPHRPGQPPSEGPQVRAAPAVRARARELGVDLTGITGSGPGGAITSADVEASARERPAQAGYEPVRGVRRAMAANLARSADVIAATVTDEADISAWATSQDVSIRLVRAMAAGCHASPRLNAWFDAERVAVRLHDVIDLGLAVNTPDGLFVPVLRDVGRRSDDDLRRGLEVLKRDVAARSIPVHELKGQTITLSNFGMLGGRHSVLTIAPPQVAILGAGRIHKAARVVDGTIAIRTVMPLSLTFDHRAVTGAEAITFLTVVKSALEAAAV